MTPSPVRALRICVYCGSRHGRDAAYAEAARALGRAIGGRRWQLVYGGGHVGLMGEVADATLAAGGTVVGIITEALMQREVGHRGLTELHVVPTMHARKQLMAERADLFIALPGGIGTMEELYEVWTWRQLGHHTRPIGLVNVAGFYDEFLRFVRHMVDEGFLAAAQPAAIASHEDPEQLLIELARRASESPDGRGDYSLI
jgi:uncharacterized protein (TIGR00730 family)